MFQDLLIQCRMILQNIISMKKENLLYTFLKVYVLFLL